MCELPDGVPVQTYPADKGRDWPVEGANNGSFLVARRAVGKRGRGPGGFLRARQGGKAGSVNVHGGFTVVSHCEVKGGGVEGRKG